MELSRWSVFSKMFLNFNVAELSKFYLFSLMFSLLILQAQVVLFIQWLNSNWLNSQRSLSFHNVRCTQYVSINP